MVTLRPASSEDGLALALVGAATFLETYAGLVPGGAIVGHSAKQHRAEVFAEYFAQPETRVWLAEVDPGAAPVGYAMLTAPEFPAELLQAGDLELRRIYLLSRFHGEGAGRGLMELAIAAARAQGAGRLLLGHHPENHRAIAFYLRAGFEKIGERRFVVGGEVFLDPVLALAL